MGVYISILDKWLVMWHVKDTQHFKQEPQIIKIIIFNVLMFYIYI